VAEPAVPAESGQEMLLRVPGMQDPQGAKELIARTALVEFKLVERGPEAGTIDHRGPNVQVVPGKSEKGRRTSYLLERRTLMTGDVLTDASVGQGAATEGMVVNFVLDARGTKEFGEITSANVGRQLAIVLDGVVESAPVIEDPITGGRGLIRGHFDFTEAQDLANVLRNGALPAPLKLIEERTVGPSLGQDSIRKGVLSFVVGSTLVVLFMLVYYRGGGVIADGALLLNVLLLVGAFAAFGFTLSLPGIAGIVLTIGMAVDANVLILERIREELRLGKTVRAAIEAGYERAWYAIRDSNVTTFCSGLILFQVGGINWGIDFVGGTMVHVKCAAPTPIGDVRAALLKPELGEALVQDVGRAGNEFQIRVRGAEKGGSSSVSDAIKAELREKFGEGEGTYDVLRVETVGPKVGKDLGRSATL